MQTEQLKLALQALCQNIGGHWLLLGGSVVRIDVNPNRGTHDIDIVLLNQSIDNKMRLAMVNEVKKFGLSPEQINSSVQIFLDPVPEWEKEVVLLQDFGTGKLFRPNLTLFTYLKLKRASDIDLQDVREAAVKWGTSEFDNKKFNQWSDADMIRKKIGLF